MAKKRGQAAIEYIILIGVLLAFLIPIIYFSLTETNRSIRISQVENTIKRVTKAAEAVNALGPGAQDVVIVTIPHGVVSSEVFNNTVNLKMEITGGISDFGLETLSRVAGSLPTNHGTYRILIKHLPNGTISIAQTAIP